MAVASSLLDPETLGWLISEGIYHSFNIDKQANGSMKSLIGRQAIVYLPMIDKSELESYCQIGRQGPGNEMLDLNLLSNLKTISMQ